MFITLGVSAEIIMVVENKHLLIPAMLLLIKVCGRQSAKAAANHNQVVGFRQLGGWPPIRPPTPCAAVCVIV